MTSILSTQNLCVDFDIHQNKKYLWSKPQKLHAVNKVSFELQAGQTLGVVGESGCGKSTLIRAICGLETPTSGDVLFEGKTIDFSDRKALLELRQHMQMIFQDPIASLNPRMTIREIISEPLRQRKTEGDHEKLVADMLERVGIPLRNANRYPHEFSGGQCQRIGIARALITKPKVLLCDEPVSALDASIQAQVVNLLKELQVEFDLAMIFVAHDLSVVHHISDQIMVMYLGGMMEYASADKVVQAPRHPYTKALISAVPIADPRAKWQPAELKGDLPSPLAPPKGCLFSTRCPQVSELCHSRPDMRVIEQRAISCHHAEVNG